MKYFTIILIYVYDFFIYNFIEKMKNFTIILLLTFLDLNLIFTFSNNYFIRNHQNLKFLNLILY